MTYEEFKIIFNKDLQKFLDNYVGTSSCESSKETIIQKYLDLYKAYGFNISLDHICCNMGERSINIWVTEEGLAVIQNDIRYGVYENGKRS